MKNRISFLLMFVIFIMLAHPSIALDISACTNLDTPDTIYTLTANVSSSATCMNVTANNVTLDCNGHMINYSQSATGFGINNTGGYDYVTVKNCEIVEGLGTANTAIYFNGAEYSNISNNTIFNNDDYGIFLDEGSNNTVIEKNIINISEYNAYGLYIYGSSYLNIVNNTIISTYGMAIRMQLWGDHGYTNITGNDMHGDGSSWGAVSIYKQWEAPAYIHLKNNRINSTDSMALYIEYGQNYDLVNNTIFSDCCAGIYTYGTGNITNNTILTNGSSYASGLFIEGENGNVVNGNNITTHNGFDGIYIEGVYHNVLNGNTITSRGGGANAIHMDDAVNNTISNSTIISDGVGITFVGTGSQNNIIYNNFINSSSLPVNGTSGWGNTINYWNTTNTTGTRIYPSGNFIGGNYYTNSTGNGFSDICADSNNDGFCDDYYNVTTNSACSGADCGNNTDYFPYSDEESIPITSCTDLDQEGKVYMLTTNVSSEGTCMNITANNVTLDCQGYTINYSKSSEGYAVNNSEGYDYVNIRNCNIVQGGVFSSSSGIYYKNGNNGTLSNNTIHTYGWICEGIYFSNSHYNEVRENIIYTYNEDSYAISLWSSDYNNLTSNAIRTYEDEGHGVFIGSGSDYNNATYNFILTNFTYSFGVYIYSGSVHNNIRYNTIFTNQTDSAGISLYSNCNYNNITDNNVSTNGSYAFGIDISSTCNSNAFANNNITTSGQYGYGIYLSSSSSNNLTGNNITTTGPEAYGIYLSSSSDFNTISNSTITSEQLYALRFDESSGNAPENNVIYNCLLNGSSIPVNFENSLAESAINFFNTTNTTGTRIYSNGTKIGGNYYTNSSGNGFSDTCTDANQDGFCDDYYNVTTNSACAAGTCGNNTDYLAYSNLWFYQNIPFYLSTLNGGEFGLKKEGIYYNVTASGNINDGEWHHIVALYDGSYIKIYIDGLLKSQAAYTQGISSGGDVWIGMNYSYGSPGYFNGVMDNLLIYNRALNEYEIRARYLGACG